MLVHRRRGLQGGLGWERDLKRQRKERKAAGKLHVSEAEAAWALVMRTREGANGDQIAWGLAPSSPLPSSQKREAQGQDVSGRRPRSPPGPSLHLSWRRRARWTDGNRRPEAAGGDERMSQPPEALSSTGSHSVSRSATRPCLGPSARERPGRVLRGKRTWAAPASGNSQPDGSSRDGAEATALL